MQRRKASFRKKVRDSRHRDVVMEAVRLRRQSPTESLKALSAHNEAVLRLNKASRSITMEKKRVPVTVGVQLKKQRS